MKVRVNSRFTYEGLTYQPGEYELGEDLFRRLRHNFLRSLEGVVEEAVPQEETVCGAPKADGTPCQRKVEAEGERCWQHR